MKTTNSSWVRIFRIIAYTLIVVLFWVVVAQRTNNGSIGSMSDTWANFGFSVEGFFNNLLTTNSNTQKPITNTATKKEVSSQANLPVNRSENSSRQEIVINDTPIVLDVFNRGLTAQSQYKKSVLDYLDYLNYPTSLRRGLIIFILSPDFKEQSIGAQGKEFLIQHSLSQTSPSASAKYCLGSNCYRAVFLKLDLFPTNFYSSITHELGHFFASNMTVADWQRWTSLRGSPVPNYSIVQLDWVNSQVEDFAEVYKIVFGNYKGGTSDEWTNHTAYGKQPCSKVNFGDTKASYEQWLNSVSGHCFEDITPSAATVAFVKEIVARYQ